MRVRRWVVHAVLARLVDEHDFLDVFAREDFSG